MATIGRALNMFTDTPDPRVSQWTMMGNLVPSLVILAIYLLLIYLLLPAYMKKRKPYKLTSIIRYYNIVQVVSCASIIYLMATSGWTQGLYSYGCQPVDFTYNKQAVRLLEAFYWTYWLKCFELVETIFFVLRKKFNQVTYLHVYHHSVTFLMTWTACKFMGGGMASVPVMLNSFIHILMYSYYFLASLGPKWQKRLIPWKPRLTIAQMVQFTVMLIHASTALRPDCHMPRVFIIFYVPNVILIFKMFYDFYQKSYTLANHKLK